MNVASMFAGVGGICLAFKNNGNKIVWANDFDKNASITYRENFGSGYFVEGDVTKIEEYPKADILTAGFPCQAFSIAGYRKGFEDKRGNLFFDVLRFIQNIKPRVIFLENVKNLLNHDNKKTFLIIKDALEQEGYYLYFNVLNTAEYGNIPQNRERIYIVGFKQKVDFEFPQKMELTNTINTVINKKEKVDDKYYYKKGKYYDMLNDTIKNQNNIYQIRRVYIRENKSGVCPTLTANMGTGGHNVPILKDDFGIRKLTPRECFTLQGFPKDFVFPKGMSDGQLYKQAGNSVSVSVIERIAKNINIALDKK